MRGGRRTAVWVATALVLGGCGLLPDLPAPNRTTSTGAASAVPTATGDAVLGLTRYAVADRQPLPALAGATLDGHQLALSSLRGRVVVLNAWASWCEPCKSELPVLAAAARAAGPGVAFVGLDVTDQSSGALAMNAADGVTYPSIVDSTGSLLRGIPGVPPTAIPSTVVLDRRGDVAARIIGAVKPGVLEPVLADLAAER